MRKLISQILLILLSSACGIPEQETATPTPATSPTISIPPPRTPALVSAEHDNDSADTPAIDVVFSATDTRTLQYSSDLSHPAGDTDDWIRFKTDTDKFFIKMACVGSGQLSVEFLLGNQLEAMWGDPACGRSVVNSLRVNTAYLVHIRSAASDAPTYIQYTFTIISIP